MNILFLGIEGVLLNRASSIRDKNASFNHAFSQDACTLLNEFCKITNTKIVCNSFHNYYLNDVTGANLRADLVINGINMEYFHDNWRTKFYRPEIFYSKRQSIEDWINTSLRGEDILILDRQVVDGFEHCCFVTDSDLGYDYKLYTKMQIFLNQLFF